MQMSSPAFGLVEAAGKGPNFEGEFVKNVEVGVDPLGVIEPVFLRGVGGERFALSVDDGAGVGKGAHRDGNP